MVKIIVYKIKNQENCGAIARVMKNFDFSELIFVSPRCNYKGRKAKKVASHAYEILKNAHVYKNLKSVLNKFDCVIGTTAILGTDYNIVRTPIRVDELAKKIRGKTAILFGPEDTGLKNKELLMCDFIVTIPTSEKYPTMNISHACAVILYEVYKKGKRKIEEKFPLANKKEKNALLRFIDGVLEKMEFKDKSKVETQRALWRRIIGKSMLTKREIASLFGFFKKLK